VVFRSATCGFASGRMATAPDAGEHRWDDRFLNADRSSPPHGHPRGHRCTLPAMPATIGFNHVATLTTDMDRTVHFYEQAFEAVVTFEVPKRDDHPWMKILDLGGGAALNVFEVPAEEIIGDRRRQGGRVRSTTTRSPSNRAPRSRWSKSASSPPGHRRSARSNGWAMSGRCSSVTPTVWNSKSALARMAE
jgi:catechol 2,3-dioxygenase-like lactoylglutathione lyase family enzyme